MLQAGDAPIDRYVVLEHLSEGGMGAIYVGKKMGAGGFEMEVVLKQLLPEFTQQEEFIDLFLREAKLSATLDHANIVHTIDLVTAGGEYFIVMEYLPGGDLRTLLKKAKRRGKRFSPAAAIYISREVLSALAYAHSKRDFDGNPLKLIHRDVSPSNILLSYSGEVKLTDFGIAKAATHTSLFYKVKGKVGYMSPEQAKSEAMDHRSDLYSLAVCMYEILTGERLFVHAGLTTSADEIYSQQVPQISRKVPGLPADMDAIMAKALSLSPDKRFQTAGEFQEALMRCAHRNGLLMSAPELANELRDACGPPDQWRGDDDDDELELGAPRAGTEVYDPAADDDDEDYDDAMLSGPLSIHSIAARAKSPSASGKLMPPKLPLPAEAKSPPLGVKSMVPAKLPRPKTEVDRFHGVELTSIINMMDLDEQGAQPLVDLSMAPSLDSGPRLLDSGPRSLSDDSGPQSFPTANPRSRIDSDPALNSLVSSLPPAGAMLPRPIAQPRATGTMAKPRSTASAPAPAAPSALVDPSDIMPTLPRRTFDQVQAPQIQKTSQKRAQTPGSRSVIRPWMVIAVVVLVALIVTLIVAFSGPDVAAGK
ncbi:MAG: serine/threonine protein kinase [Kofleriaceae bacterium]|nr:serine/threonine protein kinase [Kofleriaceae bacterium]